MQQKNSKLLKSIFLLMPIVDVIVLLLVITVVAGILGICLILFLAAFAGCGGVLLWSGVKTILTLQIGRGLGYIGLGIFGMLLGELSVYLTAALGSGIRLVFRFGRSFFTSRRIDVPLPNESQMMRRQKILRVTGYVFGIAVIFILIAFLTGNGKSMISFIAENFNAEKMAAFWGIQGR